MRRLVVPAILSALVASGLALAEAPNASAGGTPNFVVDRSDDATGGSCTAGPNDCTLRDAITAANLNPDASLIFFADGITSISLTEGELSVTAPLTIDGDGTLVTIDADDGSRIFNATAGLTLADLILLNGAPAAGNPGGAVNTNSPLVLEGDTQFQNNQVSDAAGGAINASGINGTVTINGQTLFFSNDVLEPGTNGGGCIRAQTIWARSGRRSTKTPRPAVAGASAPSAPSW